MKYHMDDIERFHKILRTLRRMLPSLSAPLPESAKYRIIKYKMDKNKEYLFPTLSIKEIKPFAHGVTVLDYPCFCLGLNQRGGVVGGERVHLVQDGREGRLIFQMITGTFSLETMEVETHEWGQRKTITVNFTIKGMFNLIQELEGSPFPFRLVPEQISRILEEAAARHPGGAKGLLHSAASMKRLLK